MSLWWKSNGVTIQMNSLYKYLRMVLFIWYIILTFGSIEEILWCDHSNGLFYSAIFSHGAIYLVFSSNFCVCGENPMVWPFKWIILFNGIFIWCYLFSMLFKLLRLWRKSYGVTIQMNYSLQQYFHMVQFI